jgi:hypothetical protein
MMKSSNFLD